MNSVTSNLFALYTLATVIIMCVIITPVFDWRKGFCRIQMYHEDLQHSPNEVYATILYSTTQTFAGNDFAYTKIEVDPRVRLIHNTNTTFSCYIDSPHIRLLSTHREYVEQTIIICVSVFLVYMCFSCTTYCAYHYVINYKQRNRRRMIRT